MHPYALERAVSDFFKQNIMSTLFHLKNKEQKKITILFNNTKNSSAIADSSNCNYRNNPIVKMPPKANGYSIFLYEMARKYPDPKGGSDDFHRLQARFDDQWHGLSQAERDQYKARAKGNNKTLRTGGGGGYGKTRFLGETAGCVGVSNLAIASKKERQVQSKEAGKRVRDRSTRDVVDKFVRKGKLHKMKVSNFNII